MVVIIKQREKKTSFESMMAEERIKSRFKTIKTNEKRRSAEKGEESKPRRCLNEGGGGERNTLRS